jgi:hypothetical protein
LIATSVNSFVFVPAASKPVILPASYKPPTLFLGIYALIGSSVTEPLR